MAAHTGVAFVDGVIIVRVGQVGNLDVLAFPPLVTATTILPPGDGMRGVGSFQHACRAVAHATVNVLVLGMIGCQQRSIILPRAVAMDAILVRDAIFLFIMGHRRLGKSSA
jgi:hypothetical protein